MANLVDGAFYNAGQSCCAVERIYVMRPLFSKFVDAYVAEVEKYKVGDPEDPATDIGPLAQRKAIDFLESQINQAVQPRREGADRWKTRARPRLFLPAHCAGECGPGMSVMMEESFGPVIGIMPVDSEEEGVRLMNDSPYGLTASIWTEDAARGEALAARTAAGTVYVNRCDYLDPELAWVGIKDSGHGCTLSHLGFLHLTRPKSFSSPHTEPEVRSAMPMQDHRECSPSKNFATWSTNRGSTLCPADLHRYLWPPVRQAPGRPFFSGRR